MSASEALKRPKPEWIKIKPAQGERYQQIKTLLSGLNLATVCQEARCPNMGECWSGGTATFMLMGDTCTRGCRFCHVKTSKAPPPLDPLEPEKVGFAIAKMKLDYVVLTSVDRDDLPDEGANHFARTVEVIKENDPELIVEVLTPDFKGRVDCLERIVQAEPDVFAHNVETVERLTPRVRDRRATYKQSLFVLDQVKRLDPTRYTKSSLMLGLGETDAEVEQALQDLRSVKCDVVTFGQYLQPSKKHLPVIEFLSPEKFQMWQTRAEAMGFMYVASGPLVRSSYKAGEFFMQGVIKQQRSEGNA